MPWPTSLFSNPNERDDAFFEIGYRFIVSKSINFRIMSLEKAFFLSEIDIFEVFTFSHVGNQAVAHRNLCCGLPTENHWF